VQKEEAVDILKLGNSKVGFSKDLLSLFKRLTDEYGSRLAALKALRRYVKGEDDGSVAALINDLGIDGDRVKELYNEYKDVLDLLLGNLGDVANRDPITWPLKADGDADLAGGLLAVSGTAELEAFLEADTDGQAMDDRISFDPDQEVLIRLGVKGKLEGKLDTARNLGSVAGKVGVKANSSALLENFFRHKRSDPVIGALWEDVTDFTLPGLIDDAEDLVAWPSAGTRIPAQWVHLELQGTAAFHGKLSWSQSALQTATITNDALNVNDTLTIQTGLEAAVSFSHSISGLFDLLICASEKHRNRLRVELHKSRSTERRLGVEVGATYGISGLDQVGKSILDNFVPQLNELVGKVEAMVDGGLPTLKQLFAAKLDEELDQALAKQDVTDEIEAFLATVGKDVDLRAKLKQVLTEAVMKKAGDRLDKLDDNIDKLKKDVKELISKYRKTLAKINRALDKAADIKIGATFAHSRQRSAGRDAFLAFEIDPSAQPKVFRKMLLCDFEQALRLAREQSDDIELVDGLLVEKGALRISNQLTLTAAGYSLRHASILDQKWESQVSLNGDVTIAVTGSLTGKLSMLGGRSRTLTFLADSRVVGTIGEAPELEDAALTTSASLQLVDELKIGKKDMNVMQQKLIEIGVLPANTSLMTELASLSGEESPSGGLAAVALLALGKDELACLVDTPIDKARLVFALAMNDFVSAGQLATLDSDNQKPLLLWPMVESFLKEAEKQPSLLDKENWAPVDSQGRPVRSWSRTLTHLLNQRWQYLNAFSDTLNELKSMQGGLQGLDRKQVLEEVRKRQRRLLKASSLLVKGRILSSKINYVFFKAIFEVVKDAGDLDPQVVLEYRRSATEIKKYVIG
jgi:hypothetical protein